MLPYGEHMAKTGSCIVSFVDHDGLRHSVEVQAESMFEAAALAIRTFRAHDCPPGQASQLEVEVRSSVTHVVTLSKLEQWIAGGAKSPNEAVMKKKLAGILKRS